MIRRNDSAIINYNLLKELSTIQLPGQSEIDEILNEGLKLQGLDLIKTAKLLQVADEENSLKIQKTASSIRKRIYGRRMVLFAPLYIGNKCDNSCLYCAFRKENTELVRNVLDYSQIKTETEVLLKQGHKRILMLCGESGETDMNYFAKAIESVYSTDYKGNRVRRINVEIAPLDVDGFRKLKKSNIGTYACFQETYDPFLYEGYHPSGPKADFNYRLEVMDRAMEGGIDDVGIGALFGLADYKYEVLGLISHAAHLESRFGVGPHTVSVPRIEPACGSPVSENVPFPVDDKDFVKLVSVLRIALPYTGIILSTRESETLRNSLFEFGISQISAGSRTNPGAYAREKEKGNQEENQKSSQFSLGDHRTLDEVVNTLIDKGFIPSFCTGCYRKGRVGKDFMDLAKPGLIQQYCMPNALFTFKEYLNDFALPETRIKGDNLIVTQMGNIGNKDFRNRVHEFLMRIGEGERDLYF